LIFEFPSTKRIRQLEEQVKVLTEQVESLKKPTVSQQTQAEFKMPRISTWPAYARRIEQKVSEMDRLTVLRKLREGTRPAS